MLPVNPELSVFFKAFDLRDLRLRRMQRGLLCNTSITDLDSVLLKNWNASGVLFIPSVTVTVHRCDDDAEQSKPNHTRERTKRSYDTSDSLQVDPLEALSQCHAERGRVINVAGLAVPVPNECADFDYQPSDATRCYFALIFTNEYDAGQVPLLIRNVESLVHLHNARPITLDNLSETKAAFHNLLSFPCSDMHMSPAMRVRSRMFVRQLFLPLILGSKDDGRLPRVYGTRNSYENLESLEVTSRSMHALCAICMAKW